MLENLEYGRGLLVILGAGASYDSVPGIAPPNGPIRPPLTRNLANAGALGKKLALEFPEAQPVLSELEDRLEESDDQASGEAIDTLESVMAEYLERRHTDLNVPKHIAALRYYLRDLLWQSAHSVLQFTGGVTNYSRLVRKAYQWATKQDSYVCFVSFNYDHLLETACQSHFSFDPIDLGSYAKGSHVSVLKPHGSVLWAWKYPGHKDGRHPSHPIRNAIHSGEPDNLLNLTLTALRQPARLNEIVDENQPTYPALALPMLQKSELVWPSSQSLLFDEGLKNGSFGNILIIGWRAAEPHFLPKLERLVRPDARLLIVTGGINSVNAQRDAEEVHNNLGGVASRKFERFSIEGFGGISGEDWGWILN